MLTGMEQKLEKEDLEALSEFRFRLRSFLRFGEDAARDAGITALQFQLLLHTQGFAGREWASVSEIAERLQAQPHGVVALVTRCEEAGLVRRRASSVDRRLVEVHLMPRGRRKLVKIATRQVDEFTALMKAMRVSGDAPEADATRWVEAPVAPIPAAMA